MELLETRRLLSAITLDASGVLTVQGDTLQANQLMVSLNNGSVWAVANYRTIKSFALSSVKSLKIVGGDQADTITVDPNLRLPTTIYGNAGDDVISAGNGDCTVYGGDGNDKITAGNGNNSLFGEKGDDTFTVGTGKNLIDGGDGTNVVTAANMTDVIVNCGIYNRNVPVQPVIQAVSATTPAGTAIHVDALASNLGSGTSLTATYSWNFGDPNGRYNTLTGFTASHVYDTPGLYNISLTITNDTGGQASRTLQVVVAPAARRAIYVDANGSDANTGLDTSHAVRSLDRALQLMGNDAQLLLRRGQTFQVSTAISVNYSNVVIGAYGAGDNPVLMRVGTPGEIIRAWYSTRNVTIENLTFDSAFTGSSLNSVVAIYGNGQNLTVRNNVVRRVGTFVNALPTNGLAVIDNSVPSPTTLAQYFIFASTPKHMSIIGNVVTGTLGEHIVRTHGWDGVLIANNTFTLSHFNADGTPNYTRYQTLRLEDGSNAYVVNNRFTGGSQNIGGIVLRPDLSRVVYEGNVSTNAQLVLQSGLHTAMIRNNVFHFDNQTAISIAGTDSNGQMPYGLTFLNNTFLDYGATGIAFLFTGKTKDIRLINNLTVAPNLRNDASSFLIYYAFNGTPPSGMEIFTQISGNVWATPAARQGNLFAIGDFTKPGWKKTAADWEILNGAGTDFYQNVTLTNCYRITINNLTIGSSLPWSI